MTAAQPLSGEVGNTRTRGFQNCQRPVTSNLLPLQLAVFVVVTLCLFYHCMLGVQEADNSWF